MTELDITINKLKESPLFYLFLSSRELFHTNFWVWLSTLNKAETIKLFANSDLTTKFASFKREHNQKFNDYKSKIDLLISFQNEQKIVIENKVKDFPTHEQLERIRNSFGQEKVEFILTTLFWSNELKFEGWKVRTYKEISDAITPDNFTENGYYRNLISDYKNFTLNLSKLSDLLPINSEYDFAISFGKEFFNKLNEIKLWEGYQKLRASHLLNNFTIQNEHKILTNYSVNNQKATLHFALSLEQDDYQIGVQIEDNQFRRFVIGNNAKQFAENLIAKDIFFTNKFKGTKSKPFLNYGQFFKYQYDKIHNSISFKELFEQIENEFDILLLNLDNIKAEIPSR